MAVMGTATYEISRGWVRLARWCGYLHASFALAYLGGYLYAPDEIGLGLAILGVVLFGGFALLSIRVGHFPEVYAVEISEDGVRRTSGAWIPWSDVVGLRERPILHRIDLIGRGGPTGITLEYQLEAFQEALDHVLGRVRLDIPHDSLSYRRPLFSWGRLFVLATTVGLSALGTWAWIIQGGRVGPLLIVMTLGALVHDGVSQISEVTLTSDSLAIRRGFRTTTFAIRDVTSARLQLRPAGNGSRYLDVFIDVHGRPTPIRPAGSDPFLLFTSLRSTLARAAG